MKNHKLVDNQLLQTNKRFSQLKMRQREKISDWLFDEYRNIYLKNILEGRKTTKYDQAIIKKVARKIKEAEIHLPESELYKYYLTKKKRYRRRILKEFGLLPGRVELIFLGTGHALPSESYNTCFVLRDRKRSFLVDAGGGNTILNRLKYQKIKLDEIEDIFISHQHLDHLLGLFWILRVIGYEMSEKKREKELRIYAASSVIDTIRESVKLLSGEKVNSQIDKKIKLIEIKNEKTYKIIGHDVTFFDIHSKKIEQYGFNFKVDREEVLTFLGDEPYNPSEKAYAKNSKWLIHEAFCLDKDRNVFKPNEKAHSTVLQAAENAQKLGVKNLFIVHSEDQPKRTQVFKKEAQKVFSGTVNVPRDNQKYILE